MNNNYISLESLKEYNNQMKEAYIEPLKKEIEGEATIAIFNITEVNTAITLSDLVGMTSIDWGDGTINSELTHTYVDIGEYKCKIYGVTSIGDTILSVSAPYAFYNCSNLTSIKIGDGVTSIGDYAFHTCNNLTDITIPNTVTRIGNAAFWGCESLTSITIPDSVTSIGYYAFFDCGLKNTVTLNNVTRIGDYAFSSCNSLTNVIVNTIVPPDMDVGVFANCTALTKIIVPVESLEEYKAARNWRNYADLICSYVTDKELDNKVDKVTSTRRLYGTDASGNQVTYTVDYANTAIVNRVPFRGENGAILITNASFDASGAVEDGLQAVNKNKLLEYNARAQAEANDEATVYYLEDTYKPGERTLTLGNFEGVTAVDWGDGTIDNSLTHTYTYLDKVTLRVYGATTLGDLGDCRHFIREVKIGKTVTNLYWSFVDAYHLKSVIVPDNVIDIGEGAFAYMAVGTQVGLEYVEIGKGVTNIGDENFSDCTKLKEVVIHAVTPPTLGIYNVFEDCTALTKIIVPFESLELYRSAEGWKDHYTKICSYVTSTDFATNGRAGVVDVREAFGLGMDAWGRISTVKATKAEIDAKENEYKNIPPKMFDYAMSTNYLKGESAPTEDIAAPFVGALYLDTTNNNTYQCTAIDDTIPSYTWVKLIRETDYATRTKSGVLKLNPNGGAYSGLNVNANGELALMGTAYGGGALSDAFFDNPQNYGVPVLAKDLYRWTKVGLTKNTETLTDEEKTSACDWIGAVKQVSPTTKNSNYAYSVQVYSDGTVKQRTYEISGSAKADALAVRGAGGTLLVGTPTLGIHATTRDYVDEADKRAQAELNGEVTIVTIDTSLGSSFVDFDKENPIVGVTAIDWGDGTIDNSLSHIYTESGVYKCKIYGMTQVTGGTSANFAITEIVVGKSVTSFGDMAFVNCGNLKKVTFNSETPPSGASGAFTLCTSLEKIIVPYQGFEAYKTALSSYSTIVDSYVLASKVPKLYVHVVRLLEDNDDNECQLIFTLYSHDRTPITTVEQISKYPQFTYYGNAIYEETDREAFTVPVGVSNLDNDGRDFLRVYIPKGDDRINRTGYLDFYIKSISDTVEEL